MQCSAVQCAVYDPLQQLPPELIVLGQDLAVVRDNFDPALGRVGLLGAASCLWSERSLKAASAFNGRFCQTHLALSSHEDTAAWIRIHAWVRSILPRMPRYLVFSVIGRKKLNSKLNLHYLRFFLYLHI